MNKRVEKKQLWYHLPVDEVVQHFKTDVTSGLTNLQARQHLDQFGFNVLPEQKRISAFTVFLRQFSSFIVWVLIAVLVITGLLGQWIDTLAIGAIVILNSVIGFIQEYKAERSLAALRKLTRPKTRVIRDGVEQIILSQMIVPGDLVLLEAGDVVPADGRIIKAVQLTTQEAALTGESMPSFKSISSLQDEVIPIAEQENMAFMGTVVMKGKGQMVVTETALGTELGNIAAMLQVEEKEKTPLQRQLKRLGHRLVGMCFVIIVVIFALGLWRGSVFNTMLLTSLSLAVAAIPEGLPAVMTIALAMGVRKMAKRKALVRRLSSVETLGRTSVICSDKTGTLTQNQMTVQSLWVNGTYIDVTGVGYEPKGLFTVDGNKIDTTRSLALQEMLKIGVLCNNAILVQKGDHWEIQGDSTEGALLTVAAKTGFTKMVLEKENPLVAELPFDSQRKRMSILRDTPKGRILFVKGAPEVIVSCSKRVIINHESIPLTTDYTEEIHAANYHLAGKALRVLALAYRHLEQDVVIDETLESDLTFVGLVAMMDPPRPEVKSALERCKKAGIKTVMITGDQKKTAEAIANKIGITTKDSIVVTGTDLEEMNDEELKNLIRRIDVYARVSPEHKIRIIHTFKSLGEIVAMTGDGVNDAPAIKKADIGIAMGITGTEVTKEASDMIILDDNFATIVNAVEEGRGIYDNITKFINYLLSSNIAELLIIFMGIFFGFVDAEGNPYISLLPIQLLWINLVTDGFPAVALGVDPIDPHIMELPPRKATEPILSLRFALQLFVIAFVIAIGTIGACHFGLRTSAKLGHTMAFSALVALELVRVYMVRIQYHIPFFSNVWLIIALICSLALHLIVIYLPAMQIIFKTTFLGVIEWGVIVGVVGVVLLVSRLLQVLFERMQKDVQHIH